MPLKQKKSFSVKTFWKEILAIFVLLLAFYFFRSQEAEIKSIIPRLEAANLKWILSGVLTTLVYVLLQSGMYVKSFHSVGAKLSLTDALELYLKRNFLSVFLPVGGVSSMAFTPLRLQKKNFSSAQGMQASIIYAYVGILTVFIIGVPIILFSLAQKQTVENALIGLAFTGVLLVLLVFLLRSFTQKGRIYKLIRKKSPSICDQLEGLFSEKVDKMQLAYTIGISFLIEVIGILMVFVSMKALGMQTSFEISALIYIVSVLSMMASPLLHGLGAVEFSMAYFFTKYGYPTSIALGATILYRVFEFWFPLLLGMFAFLWNGKNLIGRILPAAGIFFLGAVNIISIMKIPLAARLQWELNYLPIESMHVSKMMILFLGITMVLVSANLLKGHKSAYILAIVLTIVSIFGQLIRAFHYEEAILAFITFTLLVVYRKQYRIKSDKKWLKIGFRTFLIAFGAIFLFDCIGFYLLEKRHFGFDFTWIQSIEYTFKSFFLLSYDDLVPNSHFAREFLSIVHTLAFGIWIFLLVTVFRVRKYKETENEEEVQNQAEQIVQKAGKSSMDYFKLSRDKTFYMLPEKNALISYKTANGFAVVLEEPVCEVSEKTNVIREFEKYCQKSGLKTFYYRVGEESLPYFKPFNKKKALLGQEAILDVNQFSLSGTDRKSLRNGQNLLQKKGFVTEICTPPHSEEFLAALQDVSDEWLEKFKKQESIFSEGMFDLEELKKEKVVVIRDTEGKILAFLNIIPDYAPDECTYDMLRKTVDAVNGCEDALLIKLIEYAKGNGYKYLNLGMASFTGITNPENTPEQLAKYASEKFKSLQHFHGLRSFKEKYATFWLNKYLVYNNDYDLWSIPLAIAKVMKPSKKN